MRQKMLCLAVSTAVVTASFAAYPLQKSAARKKRVLNPKYQRRALVDPRNTLLINSWKRTPSCGKDQDFIASLNFPRNGFLYRMLPLFSEERPKVNFGSPYCTKRKSRGNSPIRTPVDILGIALWYLKHSGTMASRCLVFGVVPTSMSVWLDYAIQVLSNVLRKRKHKELKMKWSNLDEIKTSSARMEWRPEGHMLKGVFDVVDGARMPCAEYSDSDVQNAYYEGYTQSEEVTSLFAWNFHGEIIHAAIDFPGSWHDKKLKSISGLYYPRLSDEETPPGYAILGDSVFVNNTRATNGKVLGARKSSETSGIPVSAELAAVDLILQRIMPKERQAEEWGVRAIFRKTEGKPTSRC